MDLSFFILFGMTIALHINKQPRTTPGETT